MRPWWLAHVQMDRSDEETVTVARHLLRSGYSPGTVFAWIGKQVQA